VRLQSHHIAVCTLVFVFLFGCSSYFTKTTERTNATNDANIRPQQNHHYVIYYTDQSAIHVFNTKKNTDNLIFRYPSNSSERQWKISPDRTKIALTYIDNYTEETSLSILDLMSRKSWQIKKIPKNFHYSFKWSPDSKELAVGYASFTDNKYRVEYRSGVGDIFIASSVDSTIKSIGCKVSKSVDHWLSNDILVVGDSNFLYGVNRQNCSTLFSLSWIDKTKITFSPDGTKIFYFKNVPAYKESGARVNMPELYLANYDGKNQIKIIGYQHDPRHASWSPDGQKIVCDIRSLEWANVRHIAIYDMATGKASFSEEENELGIPKSENPYWSPDGNSILYDQTYELLYDRKTYETFYSGIYKPGERSFFVQHKILKNIVTKKMKIIGEGSIHLSRFLNQPVGQTVYWIDNQNVLLAANSFKIVNLLDKTIYTFSLEWHPIYIKEL